MKLPNRGTKKEKKLPLPHPQLPCKIVFFPLRALFKVDFASQLNFLTFFFNYFDSIVNNFENFNVRLASFKKNWL